MTIVNCTELMQVLEKTPASSNIMLVGDKGIGKSEILTEWFTSQNMKVVTVFCSQAADPGDIIGLPNLNKETGQTEFALPYWFPRDNTPVALFLDEINRANPTILQTVMDLCLNRKLAGKSLPEGSRIISAINAGEQYTVTDLDPAFVSRFDVYGFRPTAEEWLLWATKAGLDSRVIDFIRDHNEWLDGDPDAKEGEDTGLEKTPDRRAWKRVSDVLKGDSETSPIMTKIISGIVGAKAASAFVNSLAAKKIVSGREVLFDYDKVKSTVEGYQIHQISVVNDSIYRFLEVSKVSDKDMERVKTNLEKYFDYLTKHLKEGAAHFSNLYVQQTYPTAVSFMAKNCSVLVMSMILYVQGIK